MTSVSWLESESEEPEHVEREDQEVATVEFVTEVVGVTGKVVSTKVARVTVVCSCGLTRCGAIGVFGLPRPVYLIEIDTLPPSQSTRDRRALVVKATL